MQASWRNVMALSLSIWEAAQVFQCAVRFCCARMQAVAAIPREAMLCQPEGRTGPRSGRPAQALEAAAPIRRRACAEAGSVRFQPHRGLPGTCSDHAGHDLICADAA